MEPSLASLEEGWLNSIAWTEAGSLALKVQDADERHVEVVFRIVSYLKIVSVNPRKSDNLNEINHQEIIEFNEIWKLEEIPESLLAKEIVYEENGNYRLRQHFGADRYEITARTDEPNLQHHIVLLSDYIYLEMLCIGYEIRIIDSSEEPNIEQ